jgi:hypothetical protein
MCKYANGIKIYINYGEKDYEVEGTDIVVPVGGFVKVGADNNIVKTWRSE